MKKLFTTVALMLFAVFAFAQKTLVSDAPHSRIQFTIIHLGLNDITGNFDSSSLTISADEKAFVNSRVNFEADVNSINTHIEARDNHLKTADFFDAATYPKMVFSSTSLKKVRNNYYQMNGNLLMHGITKPVTLTLIYRGATVNQMNKKKTYGYQVLGTLKRSDFEIGPKYPEAVLSNVVRIKGDFELTEK